MRKKKVVSLADFKKSQGERRLKRLSGDNLCKAVILAVLDASSDERDEELREILKNLKANEPSEYED
jgi:hypothetical protein